MVDSRPFIMTIPRRIRSWSSQSPVKRIGTAEEVAKAIVYRASPDAGFINGTAFVIDGGSTAGG